jgi:ParB-like chromosome segregation protein Spo0J
MPANQIEEVSTRALRAHPSNSRRHPHKQIRQLARSIEQFGFTSPIIVDEKRIILAGHGRWLAAQQLELPRVPVVVLSGLSDTQKRAYLLADNKLAEKAGWDRATLAVELNSLAPLLEGAGLDISLTGFEPAEIDSLMGDLVDPEADPADQPPPLAAEPVCLASGIKVLDWSTWNALIIVNLGKGCE